MFSLFKRSFNSGFLSDNFGRFHDYLRISLTERCNLRCDYCMPQEGVQLSHSSKLLTCDEIVRLTALFCQLGVSKVRLTGGEPTLRKDLLDIVRKLKQLKGLKTISMTTNGLTLNKKLESLKKAGLDSINVSLDTLNAETYLKITKFNGFPKVWKNLQVFEHMFGGSGVPLKLNCVVVRGINDFEICAFVALTETRNLDVRFIEYMPFDCNGWSNRKLVPFAEMLNSVKGHWPKRVIKLNDASHDTAKSFKIDKFVGRFGFITSMSDHFCGSCNRLRLTADGNLKVCLFGNAEISLRDALRNQCSDDDIKTLINVAVKRKKKQHAGYSKHKRNTGRARARTSGVRFPVFAFTTHTLQRDKIKDELHMYAQDSPACCRVVKMVSLKINSFDFNLNETEQDANSALTDLDKGLRSTKTGEQCEAIAKFPKLFEKYPFPILINASFLKLADTFRLGNNILRGWILKVCEQSDKHIDKILNVDEFVRRIFSVIHSNDPVARAITLKVFGAVVCIMPERQQIHHSIRVNLDSNDSDEVEAAIYAAMRFAMHSKTFALSMCSKISNMVELVTTPYNLKKKLIPILQYMHHDTSTASTVRKLLIDLLGDDSPTSLKLVTLRCLSKLAASTIIDIPNQVQLLVSFLMKEKSKKIKYEVFNGLLELAKKGAQLWPEVALASMIDFVLLEQNENYLQLALDVVNVLMDSPISCLKYNKPDSKVRILCEKVTLHRDLQAATTACVILMKLLIYCRQEKMVLDDKLTAFLVSFESLLLLIIDRGEEKPNSAETSRLLRKCLRHFVRYCQVEKSYCESFVSIVSMELVQTRSQYLSIALAEALCAIGSFNSETLAKHVHQFAFLIDVLEKRAKVAAGTENHLTQNSTDVMLCTLIFQSVYYYDWTDEISSFLSQAIAQYDFWTGYRILRNAMRYGHYSIALKIQERMINETALENFHFWFGSLYEICKAELHIQDEQIPTSRRLEDAISMYHCAIVNLRAANSSINMHHFHFEYVKLRCEFLIALMQTLRSSKVLCLVPPPAISQSIIRKTSDELQQNGMVIAQLRKRSKDFRQLSDNYWRLYESLFDADPATLENLKCLQQACNLMAYNLDRISAPVTLKDPDYSFQFLTNVRQLENQKLIEICRNVAKIAHEAEFKTDFRPASHNHIESLKNQINLMAITPLSFARYFFQSLQTTTIKLAISPQVRNATDSINVPCGSQLAVKVEGVIVHGQKRGLYRTIAAVIVNVQSQLQIKNVGASAADSKESETTNKTLTQTVVPHNDFFTSQFLLTLVTGQHLVHIEVVLVDNCNNNWRPGIKSSLNVKMLEDIQSTAAS